MEVQIAKQCLCGLYLHRDTAGIGKGHEVGSIELSKMSLYAVALTLPFTGKKGLKNSARPLTPSPPN